MIAVFQQSSQIPLLLLSCSPSWLTPKSSWKKRRSSPPFKASTNFVSELWARCLTNGDVLCAMGSNVAFFQEVPKSSVPRGTAWLSQRQAAWIQTIFPSAQARSSMRPLPTPFHCIASAIEIEGNILYGLKIKSKTWHILALKTSEYEQAMLRLSCPMPLPFNMTKWLCNYLLPLLHPREANPVLPWRKSGVR